MSELGKRLRQAREKAGLSMPKLAEQIGVRWQSIQQLENGKSQTSKHVLAMAKALHVSPEWLLSGEGSASETGVVSASDIALPSAGEILECRGIECARIPVYDVHFSAGFGAQNDTEEPLDHYLMTMSVLRRYTDAPVQRVVFLQVSGDSMEPLLYNRDWVLVDTTRTSLTTPAIYAIICNGEGFLKHASQNIDTNAINLVSHNPAYPPQTVSQPDRVRIFGRVVLSIHAH